MPFRTENKGMFAVFCYVGLVLSLHAQGPSAPPSFMQFEKRIIDDKLDKCWGIDAGDLDGDGDTDIILSNWKTPCEILWYENRGNFDFIRHTLFTSDSTFNYLRVADLDNDGDADVVGSYLCISQCNRQNYGVLALLNNGDMHFSPTTVTTLARWNIEIADMNGDGMLDVVANDGSFNEFTVLATQDSRHLFTASVVDSHSVEPYGLDITDIDGDRDLDIVQGTINRGLYWYENIGTGRFSRHVVSDSIGNLSQPLCTDFDRDGDTDIIVATNAGGKLLWYENGAASRFTAHTAARQLSGMWCIQVTDIDGNGKPDIFIAQRDTCFFLFFSPVFGDSLERNVVDSAIRYPMVFTIRDFNGDGRPDAALLSGMHPDAGHAFDHGQLTVYANGSVSSHSKRDQAIHHAFQADRARNGVRRAPGHLAVEVSIPAGTAVGGGMYSFLGRKIAVVPSRGNAPARRSGAIIFLMP
jgi:hypothetical protein